MILRRDRQSGDSAIPEVAALLSTSIFERIKTMSGFAATRPQPGPGTRSAGEYKMSLPECRHFARDEFSLYLFSSAVTPMSRSEFSLGPGLTPCML